VLLAARLRPQRLARGLCRLGWLAQNDQPHRDEHAAADLRADGDFVGDEIIGQGGEVVDEIEPRAIRRAEDEALPLQTNDQVSAALAGREEPLPRLGVAVSAVGDPHLAWHRGAATQRFGAMAVGDFEVGEAAGAEIEHAMHAPVGAGAAGARQAGAVGDADAATRPVQGGAGRFVRQQAAHDRVEKIHRLVEAVFDRGVAQLGEVQQSRPASRFTQRHAAWATRQGQTQQGGPVLDFAPPSDGLVLEGQRIEVQVRRQAGQKGGVLIEGGRCCVMHLSLESYRFAPGQALF